MCGFDGFEGVVSIGVCAGDDVEVDVLARLVAVDGIVDSVMVIFSFLG